ncbi:MAG TPA: phosphohistidine phosphatase SixA [Terriglobales bacterium]|nr:phosphohistidine phosphatase SixA [Terriglobales bacterium]
MILYFLRHASAGQRQLTGDDDKRPLDKTGIEQCQQMGRMLAALGAEFDAIVTSPLERAARTAALVAQEIEFKGKISIDDALRPEGTYDSFRQLLRRYAKAETLMVVGHNPNLSEFLSLLISDGSADTSIYLRKGALARVEVEGKGIPQLNWCVTPKLVRKIQESTGTSSRPKTSRK